MKELQTREGVRVLIYISLKTSMKEAHRIHSVKFVNVISM